MAAARVEAPVAFQWSPFPSIFSAVKAWLTLCCRIQFLSAPLLVSVYCVFFAHALDLNLRIYHIIDIHITYSIYRKFLKHIYLSSLLSVEYVFWFLCASKYYLMNSISRYMNYWHELHQDFSFVWSQCCKLRALSLHFWLHIQRQEPELLRLKS